MKCPVCKDVTLLMMDKNWIQIDYCPECRWVWLDRWELEKLISSEKKYSQEYEDESQEFNRNYGDRNDHYDDKNYHNNNSHNHYSSHTKHKKKSFFEAFDMFD